MSEIPTYELEAKAAEQRQQLRDSLAELRDRVRESINVKATVGRHVVLISGMVALAALLMGYGFGGLVRSD